MAFDVFIRRETKFVSFIYTLSLIGRSDDYDSGNNLIIDQTIINRDVVITIRRKKIT